MKKLICIWAVMFLAVTAFSQTQQGYVKTKGRMDSKGNLIPGQGLKGATVSIKGRTTILVNADDGAFSFPVPNTQFYVNSVRKKGYQLVDMEACPRSYKYSSNPIYIVMETPEQQLQDKLDAERKIRRNLQKQLQEREDEIEDLKAKQKISDEEYRQALQKLYQNQENNEQLVSDMAKRFSELDYDQLDEFYRQVSYYIEKGELVKADSLLSTRGDITEQVGGILRRGQALREEKEQLQKAEAVQQADLDEAAQRCYSYFETYASQHLNDTAAYYLELRASLDTTNVDWQNETGRFIQDYLGDYELAMSYYRAAMRQSLIQGNDDFVLITYNYIGNLYIQLGKYHEALLCHKQALPLTNSLYGNDSPESSYVYGNIALVYSYLGALDSALYYINKALPILEATKGQENLDVADAYSIIGNIYSDVDPDKAMLYYKKSLNVNSRIFGVEHPHVALDFNNIGYAFSLHNEFDSALYYYKKAMTIQEKTIGKMHPQLGITYSNIGYVLIKQDKCLEAENYFNKAMSIFIDCMGTENPFVATLYNQMSGAFLKQGDYAKALEYASKCLCIREKVFGSNHIDVATAYNNLGYINANAGNYEIALHQYEKALEIRQAFYGENNAKTIKIKQSIEHIQAIMNGQEDE